MSAQYFFTMHTGPTPGKTFDLQGATATIGREANNEVVINDPEVSRKHARLTFQGGTWVIEDLGSTNGTFVNESRLSGPYSLRLGDVVGLGEKIKLVYETSTADMNATMVAPPPTAAVPLPSQPVYQQAPVAPPPPVPQPVYAGQVPANPPPYADVPPPAAPPKNNRTILIVIVAVILLCLVCCCIGAFWYIDSNALYCEFFPFLFGSACP